MINQYLVLAITILFFAWPGLFFLVYTPAEFKRVTSEQEDKKQVLKLLIYLVGVFILGFFFPTLLDLFQGLLLTVGGNSGIALKSNSAITPFLYIIGILSTGLSYFYIKRVKQKFFKSNFNGFLIMGLVLHFITSLLFFVIFNSYTLAVNESEKEQSFWVHNEHFSLTGKKYQWNEIKKIDIGINKIQKSQSRSSEEKTYMEPFVLFELTGGEIIDTWNGIGNNPGSFFGAADYNRVLKIISIAQKNKVAIFFHQGSIDEEMLREYNGSSQSTRIMAFFNGVDQLLPEKQKLQENKFYLNPFYVDKGVEKSNRSNTEDIIIASIIFAVLIGIILIGMRVGKGVDLQKPWLDYATANDWQVEKKGSALEDLSISGQIEGIEMNLKGVVWGSGRSRVVGSELVAKIPGDSYNLKLESFNKKYVEENGDQTLKINWELSCDKPGLIEHLDGDNVFSENLFKLIKAYEDCFIEQGQVRIKTLGNIYGTKESERADKNFNNTLLLTGYLAKDIARVIKENT